MAGALSMSIIVLSSAFLQKKGYDVDVILEVGLVGVIVVAAINYIIKNPMLLWIL